MHSVAVCMSLQFHSICIETTMELKKNKKSMAAHYMNAQSTFTLLAALRNPACLASVQYQNVWLE